ncbi:MAG: type IVB secretion system protein IcmQ [Pseudomonadota bacterium]
MDDKEKTRELYRDVEMLVNEEKALRKKYGIGERYKAISSRLDAVLQSVRQAVSLPPQEVAIERSSPALSEGQQYVFVHLFNNKGKVLSRWEAMLSPRQLAEYSVNRPIYAEQKQVEAYIRSRPNDDEHAFLMMKIEQSDVLQRDESTDNYDSLGHPLLKLKEGAFKEQGLIYFFHKGVRYILSCGHLIAHEQ